MGIAVTHSQIVAELAAIKRESFKNEAHERVELQLLSTRIQLRVVRGATSDRDARKKFRKFVAAYTKRWRARTVCAAEFTIGRCSNGPAPR